MKIKTKKLDEGLYHFGLILSTSTVQKKKCVKYCKIPYEIVKN